MRFAGHLLGLAAFAVAAASFNPVAAVAADKKYKIYLSNNFVGNDWRQQMLRIADVAVSKPPLLGRVDLKVENVETTTQAQINSLNNMIRAKPDALLIDVGSPTALNPTIEKACKAGIVVITFDQVATAGGMDCRETEGQGQGLHGPGPGRSTHFRPAREWLQKGSGEIPRH
jgi:ribose transport system substrate-binding protein